MNSNHSTRQLVLFSSVLFMFFALLLISFNFSTETKAEEQNAMTQVVLTDVNTPTPMATPIPTILLIAAIQNINRGQTITPDLIDYREWPALYAPISAVTNPEDIIGKIARTDIFREQPILVSMITQNLSELGAIGSDIGALLPRGLRAVTLYLPFNKLPLGMTAGDRIDVFYTTNEDGFIQTRIAYQDALVIYVGFPPEGGKLIPNSLPSLHQWEEFGPEGFETRYFLDDSNVRVGDTVTFSETTTNDGDSTQFDPNRLVPVTFGVPPQVSARMLWLSETETPISIVMRPANEIGTVDILPVNENCFTCVSLRRNYIYNLESQLRNIIRFIDRAIDLR